LILDTTSKIVRFRLGAAPAAEIDWISAWADHDRSAPAYTPGDAGGQSNGTSNVTVVSAPGPGVQRNVRRISWHNLDASAVTIIVERYDGTNARRWYSATIDPGWTLEWSDGSWHVYDSDGLPQGAGGGGTSGITVEEVDGSPSLAGITKIQFDQADGLVVSQPVAGTARIDSSGTPAPDEEARFLALWGWLNGGL
jgi:hypothetical protein